MRGGGGGGGGGGTVLEGSQAADQSPSQWRGFKRIGGSGSFLTGPPGGAFGSGPQGLLGCRSRINLVAEQAYVTLSAVFNFISHRMTI